MLKIMILIRYILQVTQSIIQLGNRQLNTRKPYGRSFYVEYLRYLGLPSQNIYDTPCLCIPYSSCPMYYMPPALYIYLCEWGRCRGASQGVLHLRMMLLALCGLTQIAERGIEEHRPKSGNLLTAQDWRLACLFISFSSGTAWAVGMHQLRQLRSCGKRRQQDRASI